MESIPGGRRKMERPNVGVWVMYFWIDISENIGLMANCQKQGYLAKNTEEGQNPLWAVESIRNEE